MSWLLDKCKKYKRKNHSSLSLFFIPKLRHFLVWKSFEFPYIYIYIYNSFSANCNIELFLFYWQLLYSTKEKIILSAFDHNSFQAPAILYLPEKYPLWIQENIGNPTLSKLCNESYCSLFHQQTSWSTNIRLTEIKLLVVTAAVRVVTIPLMFPPPPSQSFVWSSLEPALDNISLYHSKYINIFDFNTAGFL